MTRRVAIPVALGGLLALECILLLFATDMSSLPLTGDAVQYDAISRNLLFHGAFSTAQHAPYDADVLRTPGYPLFLALFRVFDAHARVPVQIAQFALVGASAALLYGIGRRL